MTIGKRVALTLVLLASGCARGEVTKEKYFSGKPVDHWLQAVASKDPLERKRAADVLGNVGPVDKRSVAALMSLLGDDSARVRDAAVLGLSKLGTFAAEAAPVLEKATKDADEKVRGHASAALVRVRGEGTGAEVKP
jgi:hypothetical protein